MMVYDLDDFMILNIKGVDYRCFVFNMSKNDTIKLLSNSNLDIKGISPVGVIKEEAFGGTYFRDIYSGINGIKTYEKNLMS